MKKLFLFISALCLSTGLWAQSAGMDTIAFYAFPESTYPSSTSGKNIAGTNCTVEYSGVGNNANNSSVVDGIYYLKFTGGSSYVKLTPTGGEQVKPNDSVFVVLNHASKRELGVYLKTQGTGRWISATQSSNGQVVTAKAKLTRDDIDDDGSISFFRKDGNSTFVRSFLVTRDPNAAPATYYYITYYNQNGSKMPGLDSVAITSPTLTAFKYTATDLPAIASGDIFRGWYTALGRKIQVGEVIEGDMNFYAKVNAIEQPVAGALYKYDLTNPNFYAEDHECFNPTNGAWKSASDGWEFSAGGNIQIPVSQHVYIETVINGTKNIQYYDAQTEVNIALQAGDKVKEVNVYNVQEQLSKVNGYYQISAGDVNAFLIALKQLQNGDKIFLPNGDYDLGNANLTDITKNNVSIIGESKEGTIIRNKSLIVGIGATATIRIIDDIAGTYLQDLTLQNNFDYYKTNDGVAVALQDRGGNTVCKNVRLLSHQDTYYSNKIGKYRYFEDCEIHGTVDFICGDGSVYFKNNLLVCEKRYSSNNGGSDAITASNADASDKGYVFEGCRIRYAEDVNSNNPPIASLGRSWNNAPKCVYLNTIMDNSNGNLVMTYTKSGGTAKDNIARWHLGAMNALPTLLGEYHSVDLNGNVVSPTSNNVTFVLSSNSKQMETILTAEQAATYSYANFFGTTWDPAAIAEQASVTVEQTGSTVSWTSDATVFLVYADDELIEMTTEKNFDATLYADKTIYVRAANERGGFGVKTSVDGPTALDEASEAGQSVRKYIDADGRIVIEKDGKKYGVLGF